MIYLHENGVTVVASDEAKRGKVYELNGDEYYVARGVADIKRIVDSGEYNLNRVITSKLTSLNYLFQIRAGWNNKAVPDNFKDDISNWDTSNVTEMKEVFSGWPTFNGDISNWDTSRVESMHGMFKTSKKVGNYFSGPSSFNQPIGKWDVRNVVDMSEMFLGATSFNQDISNWNVSNVENIEYMFSGATSFNQDISNWDVSNVKDMHCMFSNITSIGIVAFVGTYEHDYADSTSFNQDISNWDVSNVENMREMFRGATSFNQDISKWNVSKVEFMYSMFSGATSFNQPIGNWNVNKVKYMSSMFSGATSFNQNISNWNVINVEAMGGMFRGATSFNQPIGNWNVSKVTSMREMFSGSTSFNQDINGWNVSSLIHIAGMFYGATSFNSPMGKWKLNAVTDMEDMFREATSFNQDISSWDVSNVIQMKGLFQDASSFNQDLRNWKLNEKLPKSRTMFTGAKAFKIKEYSPFLNKETKKRKIDNSTANLSSEDKRTYSKIKKLLVSRDTDQIDLGVELAVSLNNSSIFSSLLAECKLTKTEDYYGEIETKLATNKLFTGSGPAQPYLNYALLSIIANTPENENIEIDESIQIKNIIELNLKSISFKHDWSNKCKIPEAINKFIYLEKLTFKGSLPITPQNNMIKELKCDDVEGSLKWLTMFKKLEKLDISFSSYGDDIEHLDSFKDLESLRELEFNGSGKESDINFLSESKNLQKLKLYVNSSYSSNGIDDISVFSNFKNLEELGIIGIHSNLDISPIGGCKSLKNLNLSFNDQNIKPDLSMLSSCNQLSDLTITGCSPHELNAKIEDINGIKLAKNLNSIRISDIKITGIEGGSLSNDNPKIKTPPTGNKNIKRVDADELTIIDNVTHYNGTPFTGSMYYNFGQSSNSHRSFRPQHKELDQIEREYEMVKGLKHGYFKHFYAGGKLTGKLRIEHNFIENEHDKIIGFYDGNGNNYVGKELCVGANALELLGKDSPVFFNKYGNQSYNINQDNPDGLAGALFYYKENIFSGKVLVHRYVGNWEPHRDLNRSLYGILFEESREHIPGNAPEDNYMSFLITVNEGRLTGEFCASSASKFFYGNTEEVETKNSVAIMKIKDSSTNKSDVLTLKGKSIVVTGVFENYSRDELKALIKENGGSPSSSVTPNTFLILAGSKMGPKKKVLADKLGVKITNINNFIDEYINKKEDENSKNEINFIDIFFPEKAQKKTVSKKKLKTEDKKTFTKIKSLLQERDFDKIDMGVELLRSINIIAFYEALLADCKINHKVESQSIISNKFFTGSGPAQPYLNYALYLLIYYCPDEAEIDDSLRKSNIKRLNTNMFFKQNYEIKYRLPLIENFTSLDEFEINIRAFDLDYTKLKDILKNNSAEKIRISDAENSLMWLRNFPQLKDLTIGTDGYGGETKDYEVFKDLTNLEDLEMNCSKVENIDFLKNCVKITKLNLTLRGRYSEPSLTQNIDALKYLTKLEELYLYAGDKKSEFSFDGLSYCKNLRILVVSSHVSDELLKNLKNCVKLERFSLQSAAEFNVKLNLSNFYGIKKLDKLKTLNLEGLTLLESNSKLFI